MLFGLDALGVVVLRIRIVLVGRSSAASRIDVTAVQYRKYLSATGIASHTLRSSLLAIALFGRGSSAGVSMIQAWVDWVGCFVVKRAGCSVCAAVYSKVPRSLLLSPEGRRRSHLFGVVLELLAFPAAAIGRRAIPYHSSKQANSVEAGWYQESGWNNSSGGRSFPNVLAATAARSGPVRLTAIFCTDMTHSRLFHPFCSALSAVPLTNLSPTGTRFFALPECPCAAHHQEADPSI